MYSHQGSLYIFLHAYYMHIYIYIYVCMQTTYIQMFAHIWSICLFVCFYFFLGTGLYFLPLYFTQTVHATNFNQWRQNGMFLHGQSFQLLVQEHFCGEHKSMCGDVQATNGSQFPWQITQMNLQQILYEQGKKSNNNNPQKKSQSLSI